MNRDCDIGRFPETEFHGDMLSEGQIRKVLEKFNIPPYDAAGQSRNASELIADILKMTARPCSFTATRQLGDAMQSLRYTGMFLSNVDFDSTEKSDELDAFLGTFRIVQGGVS